MQAAQVDSNIYDGVSQFNTKVHMAQRESRERKTGSIQSLERGLAVLMAVADARRDIGLGDLVERTALDRSCVFRLAQTLVDKGFLSQSPHTKQYRLGGGVWQLAGLLQ